MVGWFFVFILVFSTDQSFMSCVERVFSLGEVFLLLFERGFAFV
jgi:hypothetical protein